MGKKSSKSSSSPMKAPKHEIKPQLNMMKILRPKVYITDTSNFKTLVQELTGNGNYPAAAAEISPLPPTATWEVPFLENYQDFHHHQYNLVYQENMISSSLDVSSDFAASVEASPESLPVAVGAANGEMEERQKMEFYKGLEAMMMEMDSDYLSDYYANIFQQDEVCLYDYDLSHFV